VGESAADGSCGVTEFVCEVEEEYRSACAGLDFYSEQDGMGYCVLHFPGEKKSEDFEKVRRSKLARKDYDFGGTVFPEGTSNFEGTVFDANTNFAGAPFVREANFSGTQFSGERTSFEGAHFSGEVRDFEDSGSTLLIGEANFSGAHFSGEEVNFQRAHFRGDWISFSGALFSAERTDFSGVQFIGDTSFERTNFFSGAGTTFQEAKFAQEVNFREATFRERVAFWGSPANRMFDSQAWAQFHGSRIEKPELLTFNTVYLHPGWFINADVRKVDFTDVKWYGMPGGPKGTLDE
jgi:uncharacterized protein YjbI with pentapeptide repeats